MGNVITDLVCSTRESNVFTRVCDNVQRVGEGGQNTYCSGLSGRVRIGRGKGVDTLTR